MASAPRDENREAGLIAKSDADNTPIVIEADPVTKRLKVSAVITSGGGGSSDVQYAEGVTTNPATGTVALGRYTVTPPALTDGKLSAPQLDSTSNLKVRPQMASADFWPYYNRMDIGGGPLQTDVAGALITRGAISTDEGTGRANFTGASVTRSLGTCTFTNGSATVTGSGFTTTDVHYLDWVKLTADAENAYAQVAFINSNTQLTLFTTYTGTGGTGAAVVSQMGTITGTGATISVASGQLTIAAGTNTSATSAVYRGLSDGPSFSQTSLSISQRVVNQDIYVGAETQITDTVQSFSRFHFNSTTSTQVITETGYNPTGAPTASEQETNTITLPGAANTASLNTYKIEQQYDKIVFYINNIIVATHTKRIPHVTYEGQNSLYFDIRVVNSGVVTNTNIVADYLYTKNYDRVDVYQSSLSQVQLTDGTTNVNVTATGALKNDLASIAGTVTDTNSGVKSAGTQRIVLATDQPNFTTPLNINVSQMSGVTPSSGNGTTDSGTQRMTISSDSTGQMKLTDGTNIANILKSDGTAAGQNAQLIAATYLSATWSVSTPSTVLATDAGNYKWVSVHITAYTSGTINFQGSNDNSTWVAINLSQEGVATAATATAASSASLWSGPLNFRYFRLNITGAGSTNAGTVVFSTAGGALATFGISAAQSGTWTVGSNSATGSAVPANAFYIGINSGGNLTSPLTTADSGDAVSTTASAILFRTVAEGYNFNGTQWDRQRSATQASGTTGTGLLGVGLLEFDGTNYQRVPSARFAPSTTSLNTYSAQISTNTTTTPTSSTAYISSIVVSVTGAGTTSTLTIKDKQGTPLTLVNALSTAALSAGDTQFNFQTPIKMVSGIDIVTAGAAAATVSVFVNYYQ